MAKALDQPSLYDTDYVAWLEEQVQHLRAHRWHELDVDNIAEELEGLARKEAQELENRLETLILHLLKWDFQPRRRSRSWQATAVEQRSRIARLLRDSPRLGARLGQAATDAYPGAMRRAVRETGLRRGTFPPELPYTLAEILEDHPADPAAFD